MKIYKREDGWILESDGKLVRLSIQRLAELLNRDGLMAYLRDQLNTPQLKDASGGVPRILAPIDKQEVWAAGVTYFRSRDARMEEAHDAGGADFYARVYDADRPELFFKSTPHRVVNPGDAVRIRWDSRWNVPEPELTLVINSTGRIVGYTIGNDMSSRDIEGENPLYLPQAKVYDQSCALGPCVLISDEPLSPETEISMQISRGNEVIFDGTTHLKQLKRTPSELVAYLFRDQSFPDGCMLMTGTGIVPPPSFSLEPDDFIRIKISGIGVLENTVRRTEQAK